MIRAWGITDIGSVRQQNQDAYYLDVRNRRAEYVDNWFNVINWPFVERRYELSR